MPGAWPPAKPIAQAAPSPAGLPPLHSTNIPGIFPREHISAEETIVFETRPSYVPFIIGPILYIIFSVIATVILASVATSADPTLAIVGSILYLIALAMSPIAWSFSILFTILFAYIVKPHDYMSLFMILIFAALLGFALAMLLSILDWMSRRYTLTSEKIIGFRGLVTRHLYQCPHDKVQNITMTQGIFQRLFGYGTVAFWTAGLGGGTTGYGWQRRLVFGGGVIWDNIQDPVNLKRYAEDVVNVFQKQKKMQEFRTMAAAFSESQGISIPAGPASTSSSGTGVAFCPACGKPVAKGVAFCSSCGQKL